MESVLGDKSMFLQSITDHLAEGVFAVDTEGCLIFVNPEAQRLLGYTEAELLNKPLKGMGCCDYLDQGASACLSPLQDGCVHRREDCTFRRKDGSTFPVAYVSAPMGQAGAIKGVVVVFRDVSAAKASQAEQQALIKKLGEAHQQLLQTEKLASIGQLAAGVAHEINNPVGYVSSNLATLQQYLEDLFGVLTAYRRLERDVAEGSDTLSELRTLTSSLDLAFLEQDLRDLLRESQEGVARVRRIVQDLRDFSHVDEAEWQPADLHRGLDSTLNIAHNEIKYKAEVIKRYGNLPLVECIASQLNQVFMNILVNAAHAIDKHGTITVETGLHGDEWVWVTISDDGIGMTREVLSRIFEPFFTTKPVGKGTGLGLSLTYGIIKKHGGRIEVESEPGKGSTFRLWLPVHRAEAPAGAA